MSLRISLITATFNSANTLKDTFESINRQRYMNLEYLVIDGKSTDKTAFLVGQYEKMISIFVSEKDKGIYHAFNKGLSMACGDIIGFLNSDDIYAYDCVLRDVANLFKDQSIDAVYGDLQYVDNKNTNRILRNWKAGEYKKDTFRQGWMPPHPTLFIRKDIYDKLGYYNTNFVSAADYELMLRFIHKHNIRLAYLPKVLVKMREGGISNHNLSNRLRANREDRKAWQVNGLSMPFYLPFIKPLRKIKQFFV